VAYAKFGSEETSPLYITAGQIYVPFGAYETNMVSEPLTLELGETRETSLQVGFVKGDFAGSVYAFNGDNEKNGDSKIKSWGANLPVVRETPQTPSSRSWLLNSDFVYPTKRTNDEKNPTFSLGFAPLRPARGGP